MNDALRDAIVVRREVDLLRREIEVLYEPEKPVLRGDVWKSIDAYHTYLDEQAEYANRLSALNRILAIAWDTLERLSEQLPRDLLPVNEWIMVEDPLCVRWNPHKATLDVGTYTDEYGVYTDHWWERFPLDKV